MSEITDVYDGKVRIYRTTHSGDVWQMRMYIQEEQQYVRRSLKTRDKQQAIKLAEEEFIFYKAKLIRGEKIFSISAEELQQKYLAHVAELVEAGQLSLGRARNIKTYTSHYVKFVGKTTKIQNIDKKFFQGYRAFRQKMLKSITMTVVVNETITIKQMYKWAVNETYLPITYMPDFGIIKVQKNEVRRESYSVKDYRRLVLIAGKWYSKVPELQVNRDEEIYYRRSIRDFIVLMGNFGFRTGELMLLRNRDVLVHADGTASVVIRAETTKVRQQRELRGRRGEIFKRRLEYSPHTNPDDFVFSRFRKAEPITKDLLYGYFKELVREVKNKYEDFDSEKTLYSLRHFWITLHLLAGKVDVYKIARYAGTSLNQIQKHYDNVKDAQVSKEILSVNFKFDKNNEIVLEDDF